MNGPVTGHELVTDTSGSVHQEGETSELRAEVLELRVTVARLEEQLVATKAVAAAEIEAMRRQLESGMRAMEAGIAARNAVIEELKEGLEHERNRSEKLAAELAEARKGWLERLLEAVRRGRQ
jgi:predicted RNase H-like nuclease (RuvC/YqgF family)